MKPAEVLLSLSGVLLAASYLTGNPLIGIVGGIILSHYALARLSFSPELHIRRNLPERGFEREPLKAIVRVENRSENAGRVTIEEDSEGIRSEALSFEIKPHEKKSVEHTVIPLAKGRLSLRGKAKFEDELGLFMEEFPVNDEGKLTVFPQPASIKAALAERRQVEALSEAERALGIGMETMEFQELREFLPGDDITKVDWKATSRLQELIVRVFRRESLSDIYILINVDRSFRREMRREKVDYLVLILTQLVVYFRKFGHPIKVVAYDGKGVKSVIEHAGDPLELVHRLGLESVRGLPPLRPSEASPQRNETLRLPKMRKTLSGMFLAAMKVKSGAYTIIVDDVLIHPKGAEKALRLLRKKSAKSVVIYPNPVLFFKKSELKGEELEVLYSAYLARKKLLRKISGLAKVIEVGPRDLLPQVVRRL